MTSQNSTPDLQPILTGERVTIRPVCTADWTELYKAASDPQIWALHPAQDRYTEPVFRAFFDQAIASKSAFTFVDHNSDRIFGSSRFHGYDPRLREIEIGWTFIARDYWGGSYNREIKQLMLQHAFHFADTVVFWVAETNLRSRAAMEKIGGVLRPGTRIRGGSDVPHVIYEIRKA